VGFCDRQSSGAEGQHTSQKQLSGAQHDGESCLENEVCRVKPALRCNFITILDSPAVGDQRTWPTTSSSERARKRKCASRDARTAGMQAIWVIHLLYAAAEDWLQVYWDGRMRADHLASPVPVDYWLHACSGSYTRIARSTLLLKMPFSGGDSRHFGMVLPRGRFGSHAG